ncbi:MAG TPA: ATP-binding protein [Streptosporangiaceae bacterium]|nr:ATP-binding protein [Streptosporangiaceae bacterium]
MHMPAPRALGLSAIAVTYPGSPEQLRAVRADLRGLLDGCPIGDDVVLCASELAANAALHSFSRMPGGQFSVRAEVHPGEYVRIEVEDSGGPWIRPGGEIGRGHGLDIIRALAADWGIDGDSTSRTIWARLDWDA